MFILLSEKVIKRREKFKRKVTMREGIKNGRLGKLMYNCIMEFEISKSAFMFFFSFFCDSKKRKRIFVRDFIPLVFICIVQN